MDEQELIVKGASQCGGALRTSMGGDELGLGCQFGCRTTGGCLPRPYQPPKLWIMLGAGLINYQGWRSQHAPFANLPTLRPRHTWTLGTETTQAVSPVEGDTTGPHHLLPPSSLDFSASRSAWTAKLIKIANDAAERQYVSSWEGGWSSLSTIPYEVYESMCRPRRE